MERFKKISGIICKHYDVKPFKTHDIDVRELSNNDIQALESIGYERRYRYVDIDGNWLHGIVTEDEASSKGYRLATKWMVKILNPVNKCEWIDDAIGTFKEINILFCYDRFCRLGTQKKILSKETLITYRDVLNFVDNFYGGNLTRNELELIMNTDDGFGYSDKAKDAFNNNTSLRRIEVMGDREYFEGFIQIDENTWKLELGS